MNRVRIELWLWLQQELQTDFKSPSEMRSAREEVVEEGTSIGQLLNGLAIRYPALARLVYDPEEGTLRPDVVLTYNERVIGPRAVYGQVLRDRDTITIMPVYSGG